MRKKISKKKSNVIFMRTAKKLHKKNLLNKNYRGGIRL